MINFRIDKESGTPIYRQVLEMVLSAIGSGRIVPGDKLPTIRELAVRLEVNPNTVAKAYSQLRLLGAVDAKRGAGVFVSRKRRSGIPKRERERAMKALCRDFAARAEVQDIEVDDLIDCLRGMKV